MSPPALNRASTFGAQSFAAHGAHQDDATTRNPVDTAREQFYGADAVAAAKQAPSLVFSYATPQAIKQARLEALQFKMQERLKANLPPPPIDPYEGLETYDPHQPGGDQGGGGFNSAESGRMRPGGAEQYQALVVPPEWNPRGDEKLSTAKLVENGRVSDYQRNSGRAVGPAAKGPGVAYNMRSEGDQTPGRDAIHPTPAGKKGAKPAATAAAAPGAADTPGAAAGTATKHGGDSSGGAVTGGREKKPAKPVDPRMTTLKQSVSTPYIPVVLNSSVVPAKGMGTTAQVVAVVRSSLEGAVMRPFLTSAPTTMAQRNLQSGSDGGGGGGEGDGRGNGGGAGALVRSSYAGGLDMNTAAPRGGSDSGGQGRNDKNSSVPLVLVQEEDLLAMYKRQSTQKLMAMAGITRAPSFRFARQGSNRSHTERLLQRHAKQADAHTQQQAQQVQQVQRETPAGRRAAAQAVREAVEATSQAAVASLILALAPPPDDAGGVPGFPGDAGGGAGDGASVAGSARPGSPRTPLSPRRASAAASAAASGPLSPRLAGGASSPGRQSATGTVGAGGASPSRGQSVAGSAPQTPRTPRDAAGTGADAPRHSSGSGTQPLDSLLQQQQQQQQITGLRPQRLSTVGEGSPETPSSRVSWGASTPQQQQQQQYLDVASPLYKVTTQSTEVQSPIARVSPAYPDTATPQSRPSGAPQDVPPLTLAYIGAQSTQDALARVSGQSMEAQPPLARSSLGSQEAQPQLARGSTQSQEAQPQVARGSSAPYPDAQPTPLSRASHSPRAEGGQTLPSTSVPVTPRSTQPGQVQLSPPSLPASTPRSVPQHASGPHHHAPAGLPVPQWPGASAYPAALTPAPAYPSVPAPAPAPGPTYPANPASYYAPTWQPAPSAPRPGLYRWQTTGPRHRPASARPPVTSAPLARASSDGLLNQPQATTGPARPQSAGRGAFSFSISGTGLTQALASRNEEGERVSPQSVVPQQGRLVQTTDDSISVATRKTTSRERNGLLAWKGVPATVDPASLGPWNNSAAPLNASCTSPAPISIPTPNATQRPQSAMPSSLSTTATTPAMRPASASLHRTTATVAQIESAAVAAAQASLQYRVLEQQAVQHGLSSPSELLGTYNSAQDFITATPAFAHLQIPPAAGAGAAALRPATAPVARPPPPPLAAAGGGQGAWGHARALSAPAAHSSTSHGRPSGGMQRPTSAVGGPQRLGSASGGAALASRPQSALPLNASGVAVRRTRPPSGGCWAGAPLLATFVAESLENDEVEMVWSGSTSALENVPGISMAPLVGFPVVTRYEATAT